MKELKYYGLHACLAIWKRRPKDIIRVYLNESNVKTLKALLKWCADNKKAYHIIPDEELQNVFVTSEVVRNIIMLQCVYYASIYNELLRYK